MALECLVPVATEVIEQPPACVSGGECREGSLLVDLEAWRQDHGARRSWPQETFIPWGPPYPLEVPELSGLGWPRRSGGTTAEGWSADRQGRRPYFVPVWKGRCLQRQVSPVTRRAGGFRSILAGSGGRRAAWLLEVLLQGRGSKAAIDRGMDAVAEGWPSADALVEALNRRQRISEGHCDGFFPPGANGKGGRVWRDEHGRIIATDEGEAEQEAQGKPFLRRLKRRGLQLQTCSIDHRQALRHAIPAVYPQAPIQSAYCHLSQHIGKQLWSSVRAPRQEVEARRQGVRPAWYRDKLAALATTLGKKRSLLCKSAARMRPEEKQPWVEIREADPQGGQLRAFLNGVWPIFRDRRDEQAARDALEALKQLKLEPTAREYTGTVFAFLDEHCELMITDLQHRDVHRHSVAESGMRVWRRLEVEPDGFRTPKGRANCFKIYQAVKYLGWSVHNPNLTLVG